MYSNQHNKSCYVLIDTIAKVLNCSKSIVSAELKKLIEFGLIDRRRRFNQSSIYKIIDPRDCPLIANSPDLRLVKRNPAGRKSLPMNSSGQDFTGENSSGLENVFPAGSELKETKVLKETNTIPASQAGDFVLTSEPNGNGKPKADPRFSIFKDYLAKYWDEANEHKIKFPFGAQGGAQLKALLKKSPDLTAEQFLDIVNNRLESSGVNHAEEVHRWLPKCLMYLHGPLDAYGKPRTNEHR